MDQIKKKILIQLAELKDICSKLAGNRSKSIALSKALYRVFESLESNFENFHNLVLDVTRKVKEFSRIDFFIKTWTSLSQLEDFEKFFHELSRISQQKITFPNLAFHDNEDEERLREIVGLLLKSSEYSAVKPYEIRELNTEIVSCIESARESKESGAIDTPLMVFNEEFLFEDHEIGAGAIGIVREGRLRGIPVAIKCVRPELSDVVNLKDEAILLQKHQLPGVIRFFGVDNAEKPTKIVMELARCSLSDWVHGLKCPTNLVLDKLTLLTETASTLSMLHAVNIIHRDIKPANILIMSDGHIKVTDFGLALTSTSTSEKPSELENVIGLERTRSMTGTALKGTYYYLAPEIYFGKRYSESSDLYAFAVTMNEVFSGRKPYDLNEIQLVAMQNDTKGKIRPKVFEPTKTEPTVLQQYIEQWWANERSTWTFTRVAIALNELRFINEALVQDIVCDKKLLVSGMHIVSHYWTGCYTGWLINGRMCGPGKLVTLKPQPDGSELCYEGTWISDSDFDYPYIRDLDEKEFYYNGHVGVSLADRKILDFQTFDSLKQEVYVEHKHAGQSKLLPLTLRQRAYQRHKGYTCDVCGKGGIGISYHCDQCHFDCHVRCAPK